MTTGKSFYSPSYTVDFYDKLCKSYAIRTKIIPYDKKDEFIDFITRTVVFHGGLAGPLSMISAYFASPVRVLSGTKAIKKKVNDVYSKTQAFRAQMSAWLSVFMYNYTAIMYLPQQIISMTCPICDQSFPINKPEYQYPFKIVPMDFQEDGSQKIRSESRLSDSEKRQHPRQFGIRCHCPNCNSEIEGLPQTTWSFSKPGKLVVLNPKLFTVDKNDTGCTRLVIDPKYYSGKLKIDKELDWFDLSNVSWNLAMTYASKENVFVPDPRYYMLFSLRDYAGIGTAGDSVAPVLSSVSDTIAMDIFKMGNEGLAFSKIDPLYIVSPVNNTNPAFEGISQGQFRDFIVDGVKKHQEGDINRILYSPMPVDTTPLFGDGKRFMSVNELMTYNNMVLGALGFSGDSLNGASGLQLDPVRFEAWNNLIKDFNTKFLELFDNVMKLVSTAYESAVTSKDKERVPTLWMAQLSQVNQGMNFQQKMQLVQNGQLPLDEMMTDLGMPDLDHWRGYMKESRLEEETFQIELSREIAKLQRLEAEKEETDRSLVEGGNDHIAKQRIIQDAESLAQELAGQSTGYIKSYLSDLSQEDYVTYAVVVKKLEELRDIQRRDMQEQVEQQPQ